MRYFLTFVLIISLSFAALASQETYHALDVTEESLPAVRSELKFQKSVGGIRCFKTSHIRSGVSYKCEADASSLESEAIYNALDVQEEILFTSRTILKFRKSVGNINCTKIIDMRADKSFSCTINF